MGITKSVRVGVGAVAAALIWGSTGCGGETAGGTAGSGSGADAGNGGQGGAGGGGGSVSNGDGDFIIRPPYAPAPETAENDLVPHGAVSEFTMSSSESSVFPVDIATGQPFMRSGAVYVPQQYVPGNPAPFMVVQDGVSFYQSTMVPVLDNMIAAGTLPVMVVIFVEPGPNGGTPDGQRSVEYDSVSDVYAGFVENELLPKVQADYGVTLTTDPEGRAAMGGSSGGAAAFTMAWFQPGKYRRILTYSGSFCDLQPSATYPNGAWEYHASLINDASKLPLRVALAVGENDLNWNDETSSMRDWVAANRGMAAALEAKGYAYRFVYAEGSEHIDFNVLQQTLPDTLRWLWQGYPTP